VSLRYDVSLKTLLDRVVLNFHVSKLQKKKKVKEMFPMINKFLCHICKKMALHD